MDEFGMGSHSTYSAAGAVSQPPPYSHLSAGGSSGGSAVAVASGAYEAAIGTDTGGSVRLPAAYCGITGFKPSYGRISRWGVVPYAHSLDTVGVLAKDAGTAKRMWQMLDGEDGRDPTCATRRSRRRMDAVVAGHERSRDRKKLRIGVPKEYNVAELTPPIRRAWSRTLSALAAKGHKITPVSLPSTRLAVSAYYVLAAAEASSNLSKYDGVRYGMRPSSSSSDSANGTLYAPTRGALLLAESQRRILLGSFALSADAMDNYFLQAQRVRRLVQKDFDTVFALRNPLFGGDQHVDLSDLPEDWALEDKTGLPQVDVLVVPTAAAGPPRLQDVNGVGNEAEGGEADVARELEAFVTDALTVPASLAGLPGVSVPVALEAGDVEEGGVPWTGLQVLGQYWDDRVVLHVAGEIEEVEKARG
jgi:aspartyl-tRNA(Asn)/glutamyl-tRNA(Gln) amidotransferase subunit A